MILFDTLGEFMQQIPITLILQVCLSGALLITAFIYFAFIKPRRKRARERMESTGEVATSLPITTEPLPMMQTAMLMDDDDDDSMPDLNMLVDTAPLHKEAPIIPSPQPTAKPFIRRGGGSYSVKLRTGETIEAQEIVGVLRDPRDGRLIVHIENVGYRTLADSPDVKDKFVKIMRELSDIVMKPDDIPPMDDVAEPEIAPEKPKLGQTIEPKPAPSAPIERKTAPPPPDATGRMPGDLPTFKVEEAVKPQKAGILAGRPKFEKVPIPEFNIASAIEAYLQHKIAHTPEYAGRGLHVRPATGGGVGVRIEVDGRSYDAVGDIEDDDIRGFLAETIQEWQERQ